MPKLLPFWLPGDEVTGHASAAVTGCRLVRISGPRVEGNPQVAPAAADGYAFGVAATDAAAGTKVTVFRVSAIYPVQAGAAITAGQALKSNATGQVIPQGGTGIIIGYAVDDAAANAYVPVDFRP